MKRLSNQPFFFLSIFFFSWSMNSFERYFQCNPVVLPPGFPDDLALIVIIPVLDDRDIFRTLESLCACDKSEGKAGVIIVVNHSERSDKEVKERNRLLAVELQGWIACKDLPGIWFEVVEAFDLPAKFAGVGLARKIAMDRAACYFYGQGCPQRPIASLDADTWVDEGYFTEIIRCFARRNIAGVSISYAHRLEGDECPADVRAAIVRYELYLRYYQQALHYAGHPYAYSCIGSAFAVRAADYVAQGGMNRRQAGEDFYFIQKLISTGRFSHLGDTCVYPSPRISARTPFGTGRAVREIMENGGEYLTYHFDAFLALKTFFEGIGGLYRKENAEAAGYFQKQSDGIRAFLEDCSMVSAVAEINSNCASEKQFIKRFFDHFNAFRVLKYLNSVHPLFYRETDVSEAVCMLLGASGISASGDPEEQLKLMRRL